MRRIVLPEGEEPRTVQAAAICQQRGIAQCILLGKRDTIEQVARPKKLNCRMTYQSSTLKMSADNTLPVWLIYAVTRILQNQWL